MRRISSIGLLVAGFIFFFVGSAAATFSGERAASESPEVQQSEASREISRYEVNSAHSLLTNDDQFERLGISGKWSVADPQPLLVESERRGVAFIVELDRPTELDGPWVATDMEALLRKARPNLKESSSGRTHDEIDALLQGVNLTADDYETVEKVKTVVTSTLFVAYDTQSERILYMEPYIEPPEAPLKSVIDRDLMRSQSQIETPAPVTALTTGESSEGAEVKDND